MIRVRPVLLLPLILLLAACRLADLPPEPVAGNPAPDFTLNTLAGETVTLSDLRGGPVVLNFWATWCAPCRFEMPLLNETAAEYAGRLTVLAINLAETPEAVAAYRDELGLTLPLLLDPDGAVNELFQVRGYPTTVFLDAEGIIQAVHIGMLSESSLASYLQGIGLDTP